MAVEATTAAAVTIIVPSAIDCSARTVHLAKHYLLENKIYFYLEEQGKL